MVEQERRLAPARSRARTAQKKKVAKVALCKERYHFVVVLHFGLACTDPHYTRICLKCAQTRSGTTASGSAGPAAPSHGGQIVEHKAGIAVAAINEIDLDAAKIREGACIDDDFETTGIENAVIGIDAVGKCHAEADTTAATRCCKDANPLDVFVNLRKQLVYLVLGGGSKGEILFG